MDIDSYTLEAGICKRLMDPAHDEETFLAPHTVQVLSNKKMGGGDRYRVIISDGEFYIQVMLATQLNHLVSGDAPDIGKGAVVVLEKLSANIVQDRRVLVVLQLRILAQTSERLGNPMKMDDAPATPAVAAPAAGSSAAPIKQQSHSAGGSNQQRPVVPIEALTPYANGWTIKARCTMKGDIKTWSNARGEGKLFNITLMDESAEIRATAFNQAAEELFEKVQEGKVYYVSRARVNLAKKQFSNVNNNYELSVEKHTEFEECHDMVGLPQVRFAFVTLADLQELPKDSTCDVVAVVKEIGSVTEITTKATGRQIPKRELKIVDQSGFAINLTLWNKQAESFSADEENPIIAFKGVRVGDYGGRSLSMVASSMMMMNPDIPEAHNLRGWYDSSGSGQSFQAHARTDGGGAGGAVFNRSEMKALDDIKAVDVIDDNGASFCCQASVVHIKPERISYEACHTPGCSKKVNQEGDSWRCDKCNTLHDTPNHRYIMSFVASDWSNHLWLHGFNDVGEALFKMTANELMEIKSSDEEQFQIIMHKAMHEPYNFVIRAKMDSYNDQTRIRYTVNKIQSLDYKEETKAQFDFLDVALKDYRP